ncbi:hypothetical protein BX667DRAFT_525792, partial [Coemansia mojavensis]
VSHTQSTRYRHRPRVLSLVKKIRRNSQSRFSFLLAIALLFMLPRLNADIKERICQIAHDHDSIHVTDTTFAAIGPRHFSTLCLALTHIDSEWRQVGLRYAWRTLFVDDELSGSTMTSIRKTYGKYTRKLWIQLKFRSIASHYRRYALTHDNMDVRPFYDLPQWPSLLDLEIAYTHKCAFPGLAAYLQPRLGRIHRLTITGRVPIDMRRSALLMSSPWLEEIHFSALPREDDSLSSIFNHNDSTLYSKPAPNIRALTISSLIDIRVACAVLSKSKQRLQKLKVLGMSFEQLITIGVLSSQDHSSRAHKHVWSELQSLSIKLVINHAENSPVFLRMDSAEFPALEALKISDSPFSAMCVSDRPVQILYGSTFAKEWPLLKYLHLQALSDQDVQLVAKHLPQLKALRVHTNLRLVSQCTLGAAGLYHLLAAQTALCQLSVCSPNAQVKETHDAVDFNSIGINRQIRVINIPQVLLTRHQLDTIKQACPRLDKLEHKATDTLTASSGIKSDKLCVAETADYESVWNHPLLAVAPYQSFTSFMNFLRMEN